MRPMLSVTLATSLMLGACNGNRQAEEAPVQEAQPSATDTYVNIRKLAADGDLSAAARLTDDPASYEMQMTVARERLGEETFTQNMKNATLRANIVDEKSAGDYAMVITKFSVKGKSDMAANFFRKKAGGYVEIVAPDDGIPCPLARDFFIAKGQPDAEIGNCSDMPASAASK